MCQNNPEKKIYFFFSLYYQMKDKQILEAHNGFPDCYALCCSGEAPCSEGCPTVIPVPSRRIELNRNEVCQ